MTYECECECEMPVVLGDAERVQTTPLCLSWCFLQVCPLLKELDDEYLAFMGGKRCALDFNRCASV
jgi:hypothetical protein